MSIAIFDLLGGASGDMILGAVVDAGVPLDHLRRGLRGVLRTGYTLSARRIVKGGLAATSVRVHVADAAHHHARPVSEILRLIDRSRLPDRVKHDARRIFERLGRAEARVHGVPFAKSHLHEAGAIDAIVDVVGACLGFAALDVETVHVGVFPLRRGTVRTSHGPLPLPAPATTALLRGWPVVWLDGTGETVTPTGAAILTTLGRPGTLPPPMAITSTGYGAGTREWPDRANILRLSVGTVARRGEGDADAVWEIACNLDDCTPQIVAYAVERCLAEGALDAWVTPVTMKKGRPGWVFTLLVGEAERAAVEETIFAETPTFGLRRHRVERETLRRTWIPVDTRGGRVRLKIGWRRNRMVTLNPEFEEARRAAVKAGVPLKTLFEGV